MAHGNPASFGRSSYNLAKPCMCQQGALNNGCESLDNARVLDPAAATAPAARVGRLRPVMPRGSLRIGTGWPLLSSHIGNGLGSSSTRRLQRAARLVASSDVPTARTGQWRQVGL